MRLPVATQLSSQRSARPILKLTALALPPRSSDAGRTRPSSRGGSWRTWTSSGDDFLISRQHGHETRCYVPREPRSALVCAAATAAYTRTAAPAVGTMTGCGSLGFRRMLRGQWCMYSRVHCRFRSREASRVVSAAWFSTLSAPVNGRVRAPVCAGVELITRIVYTDRIGGWETVYEPRGGRVHQTWAQFHADL